MKGNYESDGFKVGSVNWERCEKEQPELKKVIDQFFELVDEFKNIHGLDYLI